MAKQSKILLLMASKLSLCEEDKVLSKAAEFDRLLLMKSISSNITDTARAVLVLDLAASIYKVNFDQKTAIKCSSLKGPSYMSIRKTIENALEMNADSLTVSALCLMLQCNVQDLAEKILQEYRKASKMELDMTLPQYVCMAVYQACRISKVKVPKSKLLEKSQLKSSQWAKLEMEWTKFTDTKFASIAKKKKGRPAKNAVIEEEKMDVDTEVIPEKTEEHTEQETETYEDWRQRILSAAYEQLEKLEKQTKNHSKYKDSPIQPCGTPTKQSSRSRHVELRQDTPSKQKDTPNKQKDTLNKPKDTPNKQKDMSNKSKDVPNKQKDPPNKQKDAPNKPKDTPNIQKDTQNKQRDTLNKQKNTPNKQKDTTNKPKDTPNKQEEMTDELFLQFSPRRSPRKTPMKFEPYKSPVKTKGVRLLFSL